jgi:ATP phosphoribosyltransferase
LVGLADLIVDLVETGNTLKANNLVEDEVIAWSSARLIVNRASLKMKHAVITELIARVKQCLPRSRSQGACA